MKKNICIITSADDKKITNIKKTFYERFKPKTIDLINISQSRSLYDSIEPNDILHVADIIFIGAGMGKVNIIKQLINLYKVPIIDVGYMIEVWANSRTESVRPYATKKQYKGVVK